MVAIADKFNTLKKLVGAPMIYIFVFFILCLVGTIVVMAILLMNTAEVVPPIPTEEIVLPHKEQIVLSPPITREEIITWLCNNVEHVDNMYLPKSFDVVPGYYDDLSMISWSIPVTLIDTINLSPCLTRPMVSPRTIWEYG